MITNLQKIEQKYGVFIPYALALIFFVVNWIVFTEKNLSHDEPWSVYIATKSTFSDLVATAFLGNPGILFEILLWIWIKIGGISLEWMRLLPLIFSAISVYFLYRIAHHFRGLFAGLLAVLMYACSTVMHYYGFELRCYSLYAMFVLMSIWFLLQFLNTENTRKRSNLYFWIWGFTNLCMVYTHWFAWFFVGIQLLLLFLYYKPLRKKIILSFAFLIVGFFPAAIKLFEWFIQLTTEGTFLYSPQWREFFGTLSFFFNGTTHFAMLALFVCFVAMFLAMRKKEKTFQFLCLNVGIPLALMFLISFKYPMWVPRYVIFACVGFILIYAISLLKIFDVLKTLRAKIMWIVFAIALTGYYLVSFTPDHRKFPHFFDYTGAVEYIREHEQRPFVLALTNHSVGFKYAYYRPLFERKFEYNLHGKYDGFYFLPLENNDQLQTILELNLDQIIVFGNRLFDERIIPLLDSLATAYPYQSEVQFFAPFYHVKIFQRNEFAEN